MASKRGVFLLLFIVLLFIVVEGRERAKGFNNRSLRRFDHNFYEAEDTSREDLPEEEKENEKHSQSKSEKGFLDPSNPTRKESPKNAITITEKTNLITQLINLVITSLTNFSINDAIGIGVFIIAVTGVKIVVIGLLIWIWVAAEKYGNKGSHESSGYGYGSSSTSYGAPSTMLPSYGAPPSIYGVPSSSYKAPSTSYKTPSTSYAAPSSSYGAPLPSYGAPAPAPSYGTPSSSYGSPSPSYGAPATSYGTPSVSFSHRRSHSTKTDKITKDSNFSNT